MGLLGNGFDDPQTQFNLALASGLLSSRGGFGQAMGQAMPMAMQARQQGQAAIAQRQQEAIKQQLMQAQIEETMAQAEQRKRQAPEKQFIPLGNGAFLDLQTGKPTYAPEKEQKIPFEYEPDPQNPGQFRMRPGVLEAKKQIAATQAATQPMPTMIGKAPDGSWQYVTQPTRGGGKPMPTGVEAPMPSSERPTRAGNISPTVLKLQDSLLGDLKISENINADIGARVDQLSSGKLKLGPLENIGYKARNLAGISTPESQRFADLNANLEKLRNDSLRLNKGTQTEGDAIRAWNEITGSPTDNNVVKNALLRIKEMNIRAAQEKKMRLNQLRTDSGLDPLDVSGYASTPTTVPGEKRKLTYDPATGDFK